MIQNIKLYLLENNTGQIPGVKENPRDLTGDGFAKAKQSIKDFPEMLEVRTLVAVKHEDRFVVIGGNQRLRAMRDLDHDTAPVMVVDWPVDKINEFIIKDNVEYGVWNFDLLANEWDTELLVEWGMNLPVDFGDVDDITEGLTDENEVPEILPNPKSKIGDVWICGNHRLMCGDSTSIDAVERLMQGEKADMVFTDPPYGIGFDKQEQKIGKSKSYGAVLNDHSPEVAIDAFNLSQSFCDGHFFFWGANHYANALPGSPCWLVWDKQGGKHVTFADVELCYTSIDAPARMFTHIWDGFRRDSEKGESRVHPTQKPVQLIMDIWKYFEKHLSEATTVLDLFGGSGSTLIACEKTGRAARLMELDPKYCDVIIKRWQDYTGKDAILESTQQKFNEL